MTEDRLAHIREAYFQKVKSLNYRRFSDESTRKIIEILTEEQNPMTQQFNTINDALKWCIDHPDQSCRDGQGRALWFSDLMLYTNMDSDGNIVRYNHFALYPSDLKHFDLTTLRPVEAEPVLIEPEKPTLDNLAALENWDWFKVTLPNGTTDKFMKGFRWIGGGYTALYTALSAGWPVEFGRGEA